MRQLLTALLKHTGNMAGNLPALAIIVMVGRRKSSLGPASIVFTKPIKTTWPYT